MGCPTYCRIVPIWACVVADVLIRTLAALTSELCWRGNTWVIFNVSILKTLHVLWALHTSHASNLCMLENGSRWTICICVQFGF